MFKTNVDEEIAQVQQTIQETLHDAGCATDLNQYVMGTKGKWLRPRCALISARIASQPDQGVIGASVAELIHVASLLHDDIMDGSDTRHGKPALHLKWGTPAAITYADYLFAHAMKLASTTQTPDLVRVFSTALGHVAHGQLAQVMHRHNLDLTSEEYREIIEHKTASLFEASFRAGALGTKVESSLATFGNHLGMAYQLIDDYRDLAYSSETLGKDQGLDVLAGDMSAPLLIIRDQIGKEALRALLEQKDINALQKHTINFAKQPLFEQVQEEFTRASTALASLPDSSEKQDLLNALQVLTKWGFTD